TNYFVMPKEKGIDYRDRGRRKKREFCFKNFFKKRQSQTQTLKLKLQMIFSERINVLIEKQKQKEVVNMVFLDSSDLLIFTRRKNKKIDSLALYMHIITYSKSIPLKKGFTKKLECDIEFFFMFEEPKKVYSNSLFYNK
ncbi:hypothetical protein RFI_37861, partial [Reticulomyxa filosa]